MAVFGISLKGQFMANARVVASPLLMVFAFVILAIFIYTNGFRKISGQLNKLEEESKTLNILQEKVDVLREIQGVVLSQADISATAIPDKNPSMITLQQLSKLADEKNITIIGKATQSSSGGENLSSALVKLEVEGSLTDILDFYDAISSIAPITKLGEIHISQEQGTYDSTLSTSVYWGSYPTEIPPITQPIKTLSQKEEDMLDVLSSLSKPELIELKAATSANRGNPFQ